MNTFLHTRLLGTIFLYGLVTCGLMGCNSGRNPVEPGASEPLCFAVVSDLHFGRADATAKVTRTLQLLLAKAPQLQALFLVGDLTDGSTEASYDQLLRVVQTTVPSSVRVVYTTGECDRATDPSGDLFRRKTGQTPNQYLELGGYAFVVAGVDLSASSGVNCYAPATKNFVSDQLAAAAQKLGNKPIFVFCHIPVSGTVWGTSLPNDFASSALESSISGYAQAVVFSGHTHYPLGDERSIHQRRFTSINTSSSSYGLLPYGVATVPEELYRPRGSSEVSEALLVSVNADHQVTVDRINTFDGSVIKQPWVLRAPHDGSQFTYTDSRKGGTPPVFGAGAKVTVGNIASYGCTISFPQASDDDLVYCYWVEVVNEETKKVDQTLRVFSQFWNGARMPLTLSWSLGKLYPGIHYSVGIWAEDSWGQRSAVGIVSDPFTAVASAI